MPRCRSCGNTLGCESDSGHYIKETGEFVCDGCYDPDCDEDITDPYEQTDKTAKHTDIGGCE